MRILLDTHIALWAIGDDARLTGKARGWISDPANDIAVSAASIWEIAIKHAISKKRMPVSARQAAGWFREAGYTLLAISAAHAAAVEALPGIHADPFDRILVAQARVEPMHLLTHDKTLAGYGERVWVV